MQLLLKGVWAMSLMKLIISVIMVKKRDLIVLILNSSLIILFYYLFFENSEIIYPAMLSGFVIIIYFIVETVKYKFFLQKLSDSKKSPDYKRENSDFLEDTVLDVIIEVHDDYLNKIYTLEQSIKDKDTLFSQWIHNMKTSITVIDLACHKGLVMKKDLTLYNKNLSESESYEKFSNDIKYLKDIEEENNRLKKNLEECLNILRLDDFSRDYITDQCNLLNLINSVINAKKRDFIYKGVFPKVNIKENAFVYTDKKWCSYMLDQIISNSIKYSKNSSEIKIYLGNNVSEKSVELFIKDFGIGIRNEDLPRVFEPFFTGNNGRGERNASGIGLYMVQLISKKLGHSINIESHINSGTLVKITFNYEKVI